MDPLFLLPAIPVGAGLAGKFFHKKAQMKAEEARVIEITYFTESGEKETRSVRISTTDDNGNNYDEHGFRIGFSAHYIREREIEVMGHALSKCDCGDCAWEIRQEELREQYRREELEDIESARLAKIRQDKLDEERRQRNLLIEEAARRRDQQARAERQRLEDEKQAKFDEMIRKFNAGDFDKQPIRNLITMGIPRVDLDERIGGRIVWPEYAIAGTKEVTYEKDSTFDSNDPMANTKYYKVTRTFFPNGEMDFVRVEVTKETFRKHEPERTVGTGRYSHMNAPIKADGKIGKVAPKLDVHKVLAENKVRNDVYISQMNAHDREIRRSQKVQDMFVDDRHAGYHIEDDRW